MVRSSIFLFFLLLGFACSNSREAAQTGESTPPSHEPWDQLLQEYVNDSGWVDYQGFLGDSARLNRYLKTLLTQPPHSRWTREEQMAFWINAYNAFTIKVVLDHYPVSSIKDIGPALSIPFVSTVWDIKFIPMGKEVLDLNAIEHKKLRKQFNDPRVHFAIVCASYSCPRLLNRAFVPAQLDAQLEAMARDFIADERKNRIKETPPRLSKIFSWYKTDFVNKEFPSLAAYLKQFTDVPLAEDPKFEFLEYDWSINAQK